MHWRFSFSIMGIDIYARWEGQTPDEIAAQVRAGFSTEAGGVGYLREAYHGDPYATEHLCTEAFSADMGAQISASVLRERLPQTLALAEEREQKIYRADKAQIEAVK